MKRRKIVWVTADSFIDVDLPVLSKFPGGFEIDWIVVLSKTLKVDYTELIHSKASHIEPIFYCLKYRARDLRLVYQYYSLVRLILKKNPDLVYVDCPGIPYFLPLLKILIDPSKIVVAVHNVKTPVGAHNYRLMKAYMFLMMRWYKNFHVFSSTQHDYLLNRWEDKRVLETPLALKDFGVPLKRGKNAVVTFLNFGIIRDYKRIDVLIKAAELVFERLRVPFLVIIAGNCNDWLRYKQLIKYSFLFETHIRSIANEEIPDLFERSHYFVLPYQDIAQSGALTVALNYNIPVLASNLPALAEFIEHEVNGYVFEPGSVDDLALLMEKVLLNHDLNYVNLQSKQREFVRNNFGEGVITKKYMSYFESIIDNGSSAGC